MKIKTAYFLGLAILITTCMDIVPCESQTLDFLFESGTDGYHTFRIPAIIVTPGGRVLAFAEGRRNSESDTGDIDIVMKKSDDSGNTWSDLVTIWDQPGSVCGNPAPVVDQFTGSIFLLATWNLDKDHESEIINQTSEDTRRIYLLCSTDDGESWSDPLEITDAVKKDNWTWYATGPCHGIQIEKGAYAGRLVIPCDHIEAVTRKYYSHIIYSDDQGKTWHPGGITPQDQVNECSVAELTGGQLVLNMRNYDRREKTRKVAISKDGGLTWSNIYSDKALIEPVCQASLLRYSFSDQGTSRLLFSNPAHTDRRENMTLRISYDEGTTWARSMVLFDGPSAYSDLAKLPDGRIGCLYEAGYEDPYQGLVFQQVTLQDIEK